MATHDHVIQQFEKCSTALAEVLEEDVTLAIAQQLSIEHHIHIVQQLYKHWKRRQAGHS